MQQSLQYGAYRKVEVETASQGKLILMLFSGAIQRAERAKLLLEQGKHTQVHSHLIRAQEIVSELRGALNMEAGEVAANLNRCYEYINYVLVQANVKKDVGLISEGIEHLEELRDAWEELFASVANEGGKASAERVDSHGAAALNVRS